MKNSAGRIALKIVKWLVILIVALAICVVAFVFFPPKGLIQKYAGANGSAALGRQLTIDGPVHIGLDWTTPSVHVEGIHIANAPGAAHPNMVSIDALDFHIKIWKLLEGQLNLPDIALTKPEIYLEKAADGSKNWDLPTMSSSNAATSAALPSKRSNFPIIGTLAIHNGVMNYKDDTKNLDLTLSVDDARGDDGKSDDPQSGNFILAGQGTLQNKPFRIDATGGSLTMLRDSDADYPLDLRIQMGATVIAVKGTYNDPVQMKDVDATLDMRGDDLADLFYLTQIPLPPTPAYALSGHLTRHGQLWSFADFKGKVGQSDLEGSLNYDTSADRGAVKAELNSKLLRMQDLEGFTGKKSNADDKKPAADSDADKNKPLLPDVPINLDRLRTTDMDVTLKAERIEQEGLPLDNLLVRFDLKDGVLKLDPFSVGIAGGTISGAFLLDGSKDQPDVGTDLALRSIKLKPFFSNPGLAALSAGHFDGRFKVRGQGNTLAKVLGDSNGHITFIMSGGAISKLIVSAAGLDVGKAAVALIGKDESTAIRCAIGDFGVRDGLLKSDIFDVDTAASNINGKATINLKDETIDAEFEGHPKEASITARTPITISGKMRSPSVGLDPQEITERGVAAGALSILTPLAAIIPFIEPGWGDDSDCKGLIEQARTNSAANAPVTPDSTPAAAKIGQ